MGFFWFSSVFLNEDWAWDFDWCGGPMRLAQLLRDKDFLWVRNGELGEWVCHWTSNPKVKLAAAGSWVAGFLSNNAIKPT
jgi:hypothetical protein